jgi:hypothetical protein
VIRGALVSGWRDRGTPAARSTGACAIARSAQLDHGNRGVDLGQRRVATTDSSVQAPPV